MNVAHRSQALWKTQPGLLEVDGFESRLETEVECVFCKNVGH